MKNLLLLLIFSISSILVFAQKGVKISEITGDYCSLEVKKTINKFKGDKFTFNISFNDKKENLLTENGSDIFEFNPKGNFLVQLFNIFSTQGWEFKQSTPAGGGLIFHHKNK